MPALTSATRSTRGVSCSCPIAETTGVRHSETARHSPSSENAQQILDAAAAAREHDHVHVRVGVERAQRRRHGRGRAGALDGGLDDPEAHGRVARRRRLDHVALGGGVAAAHEPDDAGQERQRPLALGGEEPLAGEPQAHLLDPAQQLAEAELLDRVRPEAELALALPELAAAERVHPVADGRRRLDLVEALALHRALQDRGVVLQAEVDEPPAVGALELRELALDPDVAEPAQPVGHALVEPGHGVDRPVAVGGRRRLRVHAGSLRAWLR